MANNKFGQKISYRVSLLFIISLLLGLLFLGFFLQSYFNFKLIEEQNGGANVSQNFLRFLVSDVLFLFLTALCFFVLYRAIIRPLEGLTEWFNEIRKGKLAVKSIGSDIQEIYQLIVAFNDVVGDLKQSAESLEESKTVLQIKVKARTRELEELAQSLEKKVEERTKELRRKTNELQERVKELEKFHKLAVGRELKMVELKKGIEKLDKILK